MSKSEKTKRDHLILKNMIEKQMKLINEKTGKPYSKTASIKLIAGKAPLFYSEAHIWKIVKE